MGTFPRPISNLILELDGIATEDLSGVPWGERRIGYQSKAHMLPEAKTQNVWVCSKEGFIDQESSNREDESPISSSNPSEKVECGPFLCQGKETGRTVFVKTGAPRRIPLTISVSKAGATSLKAMETRQTWTRWNQRDRAFPSVTQ